MIAQQQSYGDALSSCLLSVGEFNKPGESFNLVQRVVSGSVVDAIYSNGRMWVQIRIAPGLNGFEGALIRFRPKPLTLREDV